MYYRYWMHRDGAHRVPAHYGVRTRTHKLTLELNSGAGELYDLGADPLEMDNRFGDPGVARVQRELVDMVASRPDDARREPLPQVGMA